MSECVWTFTDHLGTPLLQTNSSKAVVWRAEYEPYGNVWVMRNGTKDDQPLRFPGQERLFDGSTGTEERYNIFRWYRSGWGRYTQGDPIGLMGGLNVYRYALDNPVRFDDALGLKVCRCERRIDTSMDLWNHHLVVFLGRLGPFKHEFLQIVPDGAPCGGFGGSAWGYQGIGGGRGKLEPEATPEILPLLTCSEVPCIDESKLTQFIQDNAGNEGTYELICTTGIWNRNNCQGWVDQALRRSRKSNCTRQCAVKDRPMPSSSNW